MREDERREQTLVIWLREIWEMIDMMILWFEYEDEYDCDGDDDDNDDGHDHDSL